MHHRKYFITGAAMLLGACGSGASLGQADPYWMRSWNEAQSNRPATLSSRSRIAPSGEPGSPLLIRGQVFLPGGRAPAPDVVVHAYHRDVHGFDFGPGDRALTTWRLQGWAKTDSEGRFEFQTIRPAPDHLGREGPHVHFTLESGRFGRQWAPTIYLKAPATPAAEGEEQLAVRIQLKGKGDF
jgi:protocatechuate 3,4-dioxygenase beta subunit